MNTLDDDVGILLPQEPVTKNQKTWSASALSLEVFSIVLGVLLALALSQWAEEREHQALANSALSNISREISSNRDTLRLIHNNNKQTVDAISALSKSDGDGRG